MTHHKHLPYPPEIPPIRKLGESKTCKMQIPWHSQMNAMDTQVLLKKWLRTLPEAGLREQVMGEQEASICKGSRVWGRAYIQAVLLSQDTTRRWSTWLSSPSLHPSLDSLRPSFLLRVGDAPPNARKMVWCQPHPQSHSCKLQK